MTNFPTLCQNAIKDESSFPQFINDHFKKFFAYFNNYLSQFQKPNEQNSFRQKKAVNAFKELLSNVDKIISKTQYDNYSREMDGDISNVMEALINPKTPDDIRQPSIKIFYTLIDKLNDHAFDVLRKASELVFDFNIIKNECQNKSSNYHKFFDEHKKIQFPDFKPTGRDQFMKNIEDFKNIMISCSDQKYTHYFSFFTQMFLIPTYLRNIESSETVGIIGPAPPAIHEAIVTILDNATKRSSAFSTVIRECLTIHNIQFFVEAASQSSHSYSKLKISQDYVFDFFKSLCISTNADFLKTQSIDLIIKGIQSIFEMIRSLELTSDDRNRYLDVCLVYFQQCLDLFPTTSIRKKLSNQFVTLSHEQSLPQILIIFLIALVNKNIKDPELWDLIKDPGKSPTIFLGTLSFFSSYFAFSISESLLNYTVSLLKLAIQSMQTELKWLGTDNYRRLAGIDRSLKDVFERESGFFSFFKLDSLNLHLKPIEGNIWEPFVDATKNMNIESISDQDIQYRTFLVGASFVYPLLRLMSAFPPHFEYKVTFVVSNYLDWLKEFCSPKATNTQIILKAMQILDVMFSNQQCRQIISKEAQIDWVLTLQTHLKSDDSAIKNVALQIAINSIFYGVFGAYEILNQDILNLVIQRSEKLNNVQIATLMSINLIEKIDIQYRASYLFHILTEAIYLKQTDECIKILSAISNLLKQKERLTDIYNIWPIVLYMKELVNLNSDAVDNLILELMDQPIEKAGSTFDDALLQFICDLIIYSSSRKGIEKFKSLSNDLQSKHMLLYLSHNFNNLTYPYYQTTAENTHVFSNRHEEILQIYDKNKLSSNLAIGHFAFQFEQKQNYESSQTLDLNPSDNGASPTSISNPLDYPVQTDLTQKLNSYFTNELYEPNDFKIDSQINQNTDINYPENYTTKLIPFPQNVGPVAAAFISSSGFDEPLNSYRFVPSSVPEFEAKLDFAYKKKIEVDLRFLYETPSCKSFQEGLGFPGDPSNSSIIQYEDCRHIITFFKNSSTKSKKILVIWNNRDGTSFIPEIEARIQIEEIGERFLVKCLFASYVNIPPVLCDAIVSMESLPAFIIGRIITISKILDEPNKAIDTFSITADKLQKLEKDNFPQASRKFQNEKELLLL